MAGTSKHKRDMVKFEKEGKVNNEVKFLKFNIPGCETGGLRSSGVGTRCTLVMKDRPSVGSIDYTWVLSE